MKLRTLLVAGLAALVSGLLVAHAQVPGVNSTLNSVFTVMWEASTSKPTYSASANGLTPVSSGTDLCTITGSSTKTVRVRRVIVSGAGATTAVTEPVTVLKRSTASTGAGTAIAKVSYDSNNVASTVNMVEAWTANPTTGTLVGVLADLPYTFGVSGTNVPPMVFEFGRFGSAAVLRGVAQSLSVNFSGITLTGTLGCTFEWTEDTDY